VNGKTHEDTTGDDGLVSVLHIPPGDYNIEVDGITGLVSSRPGGAAPVIHVLNGYYLASEI
jgi:hypothetical protein